MKTYVYLVMSRAGVVSMRKSKPYLTSGQIAIKLDVEVSDKFFERFVPSATLKVADHQVIQPDIEVKVNDPIMDKLTEGEKPKPINVPF